MRRFALMLLAGLTCLSPVNTWAQPADKPELSYTRLLHRIHLRLMGRSPTIEEYQAVINAQNDEAREAMMTQTVDNALESQAFYDEVLNFGYEYLDVGRYRINANSAPDKNAAHLVPCPQGSLHADRFGLLRGGAADNEYICHGDGGACRGEGECPHGYVCDNEEAPRCKPVDCDPNAEDKDAACGTSSRCRADGKCAIILSERSPWWAPNSTIKLIGWAGEGHRTMPDGFGGAIDCGIVNVNNKGAASYPRQPSSSYVPTYRTIKPRCGCGPDLIYCDRGLAGQSRTSLGPSLNGLGRYIETYDDDPNGRGSSVFQESGRLFAHIVVNDRPFTDLVEGDYTVMNLVLQHFYIRTVRQTGRFTEFDTQKWWQNIADPNEWREVKLQDVNPFYLSDRNTRFDPRIQMGEPPGIPAAGVLTTLGASGSFARERPRAARWLENLACRQFIPPPADVHYGEVGHDIATSGSCKHCHVSIDPAAIHFKRFALMGSGGIEGQGIGGISPYRWTAAGLFGTQFSPQKARWEQQYLPDTVMTPATQAQIDANPDARFIDFAPPGTTLLGVESDGTIGPLGFGKMIVKSGAFDRCAVRRFYERYAGLKLDPAKHRRYIDKLVSVYANGGKRIRPFIKWITQQPRFRQGH